MKTRVVNRYKEPYDVYIGRGTIWGNKFRIGIDGTREEVIQKYKRWLLRQPELLDQIHTLRGFRLGCSCKPKPCHGDILVDIIEGRLGV